MGVSALSRGGRVALPLTANSRIGTRHKPRAAVDGAITIIPFQRMLAEVDDPFLINGVSVAPIWSYRGDDATNTNWVGVAGPTLTKSGTNPNLNILQPLMDKTLLAVEMTGGVGGPQYNDNTGGSIDLGTDDLILEYFGTSASSATTTCNYISAFDTTAPEGAWRFGDSGSNARFFVQLAGVGVGINGASGGNTGFFHALVFVDRSDTGAGTGMQIFVNGELKASGTFTLAQTAASLTGGGKKLVVGGSDQAGSAAFGGNIGFVRVAKSANLFPGGAANTTLWADVAAKRFFDLSGYSAQRYPVGAVAYPTKVGKSIVNQVVVETTDNRLVMVPTSSATRGGFITIVPEPRMTGMMRYNAATNTIRRSSDLTLTWTTINAAVATVSNTPSPCWNRNGYGVTSTLAVVGQHGVQISTSAAVAVSTQSLSVFLKQSSSKTAARYCKINCSTTANAFVFVDLETQAISSTGAAVLSSGAEDWGGGWKRYWFSFATTAAIVQTVQLLASTDGTTDSFAGTGVVDFIANGAQLEGNVRPTGWIETTTSSLTRSSSDGVFYDNSLIPDIQNCIVQMDMGCPTGAQPNATGGGNTGRPLAYGWSDQVGGARTEISRLTTLQANYRVQAVANILSVNDVASGSISQIRIRTQDNNFQLFINGILEGSDLIGVTTITPTWFWYFSLGTIDPLNNGVRMFKLYGI